MKNFFLLICITIALFSCKKKESVSSLKTNIQLSPETAKEQFKLIVLKAISQKEFRDFLKKEATKRFNLDYDVFYPLVKKSIVYNNKTLESYFNEILKSLDSDITINDIEKSVPLLTILIPELRDFSAQRWDTENIIPLVAIRDLNDKKNGKPIIANSVTNEQIELSYTAKVSVPIIFIKDNEGVIYTNDNYDLKTQKLAGYSFSNKPQPFLKTDLFSYYFTDERIPNIKKHENESLLIEYSVLENSQTIIGSRILGGACDRLGLYSNFDSKVIEAFEKNIYNPICPENTATVRDYVYYGIDPTTGVNQGPLNYSYREYITSIKCDNLMNRHNFDDISDGSILDFDITVLTVDNDPIFPLKKRLSVNKDLLFHTDADNSTPIAYDLTVFPRLPLELAVWNFKRQGDIWKFSVFEFDPSTVTTISYSTSATLGTNFTSGDEKEGGKFGTTTSISASATYTLSIQASSDDLGHAILYWCDPVIKETLISRSNTENICGLPDLRRPPRDPINGNKYGRTNEISTGAISLTVEPRFKP